MPDERETSTELELDFSKFKDEKSGKGLVPVIVQDAHDRRVLMLGFADEEALKKMQETGRAAFWSRSRQKSWVKGEESGNFMDIIDFQVDCDQDTILLLVDPQGDKRACHVKGPDDKLRRSCFYRRLDRRKGGCVNLVQFVETP